LFNLFSTLFSSLLLLLLLYISKITDTYIVIFLLMLFRAGIELGFNSQEGQKFFFFSMSRLSLGPTGHLLERVPLSVVPGVKQL
jgi:hypothetical protein